MDPLKLEQRSKVPTGQEVLETGQRPHLPLGFGLQEGAMENRPRRFLQAFAAILKHSNYRLALEQYMRVNARCGRCNVKCQIFQATGEACDLPCHRSELLLSVYRRHFTVSGVLRGRLLGDPGLQDDTIDKMAEAYYTCTLCRRCQLECPMGIDHGLITHLGRYILSEIGIVPRVSAAQTPEPSPDSTGGAEANPVPALLDNLPLLREEIKNATGVDVEFPVDRTGAEYLFFPDLSDDLEADTLMGSAAVFRATGDTWTLGAGFYDGLHYGLFYSDQILEHALQRMRGEADRLQVKTIVIGESGYAARSAKSFYPGCAGEGPAQPVVSLVEYTHRAWKSGRLKLRANAISERVTYHDPCNFARDGWIVEEPRELLQAICSDYVEMTPNRRDNFCCGGGGGTVSIGELRSYRTSVGGKAKAGQIRATGAKYCVAPCANCKKQLRELMEDQGIDCQIVGLHDLLYKAIVFE
jgi:Fe-S oxidoreductase